MTPLAGGRRLKNMNIELRRAARFRPTLAFAILALQSANLAYSATPDISFSPTTLDFKYQIGNALPAAQTLQIKSTGAALSFTISPIAAPWLSVNAVSGTTTASVKIYVNPTSMPSGAYQGTITVNAPLAASPSYNLTVTLEVSDPPPTLTPSTNSLAFTYATDAAALPAALPVVLTSTGGAVSFTVTASGGTWLSASPSSEIAIAGIPAAVLVNANPTGLAPGSYSGTVKIAPTIASIATITVNVTLAVNAGVPVVSNLWPPGALINSPNMVVTVTGKNFFSTSTATAGAVKLTPVNVLSPTTMLVTVPAAQMTAAGPLPVVVTTPTAASASAVTAGSTFQVYLPGPQIKAVTDAASYALGNISPGEIVTIYGLGLGPNILVPLTVSDPLSTSLPLVGTATTSVTIDGTLAPLIYTDVNQVACIVPFSVSGKIGSKVDIVMTYNSLSNVTQFQANVVTANPGLFTSDASGTGQGAILNVDPQGNYTLNSKTAPAVAGTTIAVLYMTGYGLTSCTDIPATPTAPASNCNPTATEVNLISGNVAPVLPVAVTIGGQAAPGAVAQAPIGGVPGLMQVNVPVPAGVKSGNALVSVTVGSGANQWTSQGNVTIAIK